MWEQMVFPGLRHQDTPSSAHAGVILGMDRIDQGNNVGGLVKKKSN